MTLLVRCLHCGGVVVEGEPHPSGNPEWGQHRDCMLKAMSAQQRMHFRRTEAWIKKHKQGGAEKVEDPFAGFRGEGEE